MDYYDEKQSKTAETFKYSLKFLAYIIIFWTLYHINVILFSLILFAMIVNKVFNLRIMCRLFGCIPSDKSKGGIVRCKRCKYPMYRIK